MSNFRLVRQLWDNTTFLWDNIFPKFHIIFQDLIKPFRMLVVRASNSTWARRYIVSKLRQFWEFPYGCNSRINGDCLKKCLRISDHLPGMSLKALYSLQNASWAFVWIPGKRKCARVENSINNWAKTRSRTPSPWWNTVKDMVANLTTKFGMLTNGGFFPEHLLMFSDFYILEIIHL